MSEPLRRDVLARHWLDLALPLVDTMPCLNMLAAVLIPESYDEVTQAFAVHRLRESAKTMVRVGRDILTRTDHLVPKKPKRRKEPRA